MDKLNQIFHGRQSVNNSHLNKVSKAGMLTRAATGLGLASVATAAIALAVPAASIFLLVTAAILAASTAVVTVAALACRRHDLAQEKSQQNRPSQDASQARKMENLPLLSGKSYSSLSKTAQALGEEISGTGNIGEAGIINLDARLIKNHSCQGPLSLEDLAYLVHHFSYKLKTIDCTGWDENLNNSELLQYLSKNNYIQTLTWPDHDDLTGVPHLSEYKHLERLDLSGNRNLRDPETKKALLNLTTLKSLNLSGTPFLTPGDPACLTPKEIERILRNNNLKSLDGSGN